MINNLITGILDFICIYYITKKIRHERLKPVLRDIYNCMIIVLLLSIFSDSIPILYLIIYNVVYFIFIHASYNFESYHLSFTVFSLTILFTTILNFLCSTMIKLIPSYQNCIYSDMVYKLLVLLIIILLSHFSLIDKIYTTLYNSSMSYRLILFNTYIITLAIQMRIQYILLNSYYVVFAIIFMLAINCYLLYYEQAMNAQHQLLVSYEKNLPIYKSLINDIRASQHEYSNRIQNLNFLAKTCKSYDELREAIDKYTSSYSKPLYTYPLLQIDKPLLAASLYNLSSIAEADGITIQYDVSCTILNSNAPEHILADMTCILLQNAIEACNSKDHIYIKLSSDGNITSFEIRNPSPVPYTNEQINDFFKKDYTTKHDKKKDSSVPHGLGLHYLLKEIQKYDGTISADCIEYNNTNWIIFCLQI